MEFWTLVSNVIDVLFIILPNVGYVHQYFKIKNMKDTKGFSKFISFVLIISYNIRFFFYIGERFEKSILFQSILCFCMQLILLRLCVQYDKKLNKKNIENYFLPSEFWNWPYFIDYIYFISFFTMSLNLISNIFTYNNKTYIFIIGLLTSIIEAMLDIPQIIELYKTKTPKGISYILVGTWFAGDSFKLSYYIYKKIYTNKVPVQLIGCASFQLSSDIVVILQLIYYNKKENINNEIMVK